MSIDASAVNLMSSCAALRVCISCRAFFCSHSSGACSEQCFHGAEDLLFRVLRYPSHFVLRDDVHYSEPSPPMFPIAFPKHGAHDAAQKLFQDHPQIAMLASSGDLR